MSRVYIHPKRDEVSLERVLFALSDPIRLNMVRMLASTKRVNSLSLGPGMPRATITHHTRILREAGLTRTMPEGRNCWISLRKNLLGDKFPGLMRASQAEDCCAAGAVPDSDVTCAAALQSDQENFQQFILLT